MYLSGDRNHKWELPSQHKDISRTGCCLPSAMVFPALSLMMSALRFSLMIPHPASYEVKPQLSEQFHLMLSYIVLE